MDRLELTNPDRILWCCRDFGITPEDLALETKIVQAKIDLALEGKPSLTFNQLAKIANFFGRGVLFFLESGDPEPNTVHSTEFRSLANQKPELSLKLKKLIERVEKQRELYLSLLEDLQIQESETFTPPIQPSRSIEENAVATRRWLGIEHGRQTFDSYRQAIEQKGVLVFQSNGYNGKWQIPKNNPILGFSIYQPTCPVIVVKKQSYPARQVFTLFHELGHLLLHKTSSIDDSNDLQSHEGREREANRFAGLVLVPDDFVQQIDVSNQPNDVGSFPEWLKPYRTHWGVSTETILRRLADTGLLTWERYSEYRDWLAKLPIDDGEGGSRQYRYREPRHIFGDTFVRTVFEAKNTQQISIARASRYLDDIKIKDLHSLERHLVAI